MPQITAACSGSAEGGQSKFQPPNQGAAAVAVAAWVAARATVVVAQTAMRTAASGAPDNRLLASHPLFVKAVTTAILSAIGNSDMPICR